MDNFSGRGHLIVIEGMDGSGKSTQFERLTALLSQKNRIMGISFPEYDKPSAALVKMYLSGEFSKNASDVNPYAASTFYAADRYASYKLYWEKFYSEGGTVIAGRYVSSNAVHQTPKLPQEQWDGFLEWLSDYEYDKLGLPRPDITILLDVTEEISEKRLMDRYRGDDSKKDIHEADKSYMRLCRECALYCAQKLGWEVIPCTDEWGRELSPDEITSRILRILDEHFGEYTILNEVSGK